MLHELIRCSSKWCVKTLQIRRLSEMNCKNIGVEELWMKLTIIFIINEHVNYFLNSSINILFCKIVKLFPSWCFFLVQPTVQNLKTFNPHSWEAGTSKCMAFVPDKWLNWLMHYRNCCQLTVLVTGTLRLNKHRWKCVTVSYFPSVVSGQILHS